MTNTCGGRRLGRKAVVGLFKYPSTARDSWFLDRSFLPFPHLLLPVSHPIASRFVSWFKLLSSSNLSLPGSRGWTVSSAPWEVGWPFPSFKESTTERNCMLTYLRTVKNSLSCWTRSFVSEIKVRIFCPRFPWVASTWVSLEALEAA